MALSAGTILGKISSEVVITSEFPSEQITTSGTRHTPLNLSSTRIVSSSVVVVSVADTVSVSSLKLHSPGNLNVNVSIEFIGEHITVSGSGV